MNELTSLPCRSCTERVVRLRPELAYEWGLDPRDFDWVHEDGNPYCDWHPMALPDWPQGIRVVHDVHGSAVVTGDHWEYEQVEVEFEGGRRVWVNPDRLDLPAMACGQTWGRNWWSARTSDAR